MLKFLDITKKAKRHPVFTLIVAIQFIFILILLFEAFSSPRNTISLDMNSFNIDGESVCSEGGDSYTC